MTIIFSCLSPDILQNWKNFTLTIMSNVFDCIVKIYYPKNYTSMMSSDEEEEEGRESEDKDD